MRKTTEEIIAEVPAEERQRFCQFWTGEPSRPCLATTQTSCRRCRFFTPFIGDKLQILTDAVNRENKRASSLEGQVTKLKKVVNYLKTMVRDMPSAEKAQLPEEDATSVCKCPCEYREPCDVCHYDGHIGLGCPAEEGVKDE